MFLIFAQPRAAWGWGVTGHRVIARIAAARITDPVVRARILASLDGETHGSCTQTGLADRLACVSTWADDVKRTTMRNTRNWHFVNIPKSESAYDAARDCASTSGGDCLVNAILRQRALLSGPESGATPQARAEAVKFLVHLIGDVTMPLHCVDDGDHGGNAKVTTWFGEPEYQFGHWNLHAVWDDGLIGRSYTPKAAVRATAAPVDVVYAKILLDGEQDAGETAFSGKTLIAWALEAHDVAVRQSYGTLPAPVQGRAEGPERTDKMYYPLGAGYLASNLPSVETQLRRGGRRLAIVLNELFASRP